MRYRGPRDGRDRVANQHTDRHCLRPFISPSCARTGKIAVWARFLSKVLTGFPSILAGVFVYAAVVLLMGSYSALAGGIALAVLMLPTVTLKAEGAMRMVPQRMKDAAIGMGCTKAQVVWSVTLPTSLPSVVTGIILSVARVAGESAPLLFTALFSNYWLRSVTEPTASLSILIYNFSSMPFENQIELALGRSEDSRRQPRYSFTRDEHRGGGAS